MSEVATRDEQEPSDVLDLPGRQLARVRREQGLAVADIARMLKFSERQIEALELDDYQTLQGATFVRGFVRSYAKLLKLDPVPLLAVLQNETILTTSDIVAPENMGEAMPRSLLPPSAKVFGLAAAVAAVAALVYFAWDDISESAPASTKTAPAPEAALTTAAPVAVAPSPAAGTTTNPVAAEPIQQANAPQTSAPVEVQAPAESEARTVTTSPAPSHQLVVDFTGKSWIEIKDKAGKVVLTGEYKPGSQQIVPGGGPFEVWVGNAPAVRLTRDGQVVELQPYNRVGVARLTVE